MYEQKVILCQTLRVKLLTRNSQSGLVDGVSLNT